MLTISVPEQDPCDNPIITDEEMDDWDDIDPREWTDEDDVEDPDPLEDGFIIIKTS